MYVCSGGCCKCTARFSAWTEERKERGAVLKKEFNVSERGRGKLDAVRKRERLPLDSPTSTHTHGQGFDSRWGFP